MMRSLFSGISGLRVHQTRMDVIGNNISNVNTIGFKSSRVTFNEVFSQTTAGASPANADTGRGGVNPKQIGLGVNVASIDKIMTQGAAQRTDNPFDLMIQGEGFFIVGDSSGQYFTRAGALNLDVQGNLVTSTGMTVMGWNQISYEKSSMGEAVPGIAQPIVITPDKEYVAPSPTTKIDFTGNLNALSNTTTPKKMSMTIYDSVGNKYVVDVSLQYTKAGSIDAAPDGTPGSNPERDCWITSIIPVAYPDGNRKEGSGLALELDADGVLTFTGDKAVSNIPQSDYLEIGQLHFDKLGAPAGFLPAGGTATVDANTGKFTQVTLADGNVIDGTDPAQFLQHVFSIDPGDQPNSLIPDAEFGSDIRFGDETYSNALMFDFSMLTQYGKLGSDAITSPNGNAPGTLNGISIGTDGSVIGRYTNGQIRTLAKIPVAYFKNPAGLEKVGENMYVPTANSGEFNGTGDDITAKGGSVLGGVLEMSNVDLSSEFVEMITTQRGFQANSRIISTSDEMLQELVNLKR